MRLRKAFDILTVTFLLVSAGRAGADGSVPGWNRFVYLIYKLEVTRYCSLTTESAAQGFQVERKAMLDKYDFNENLIESARTEAWKLAYKEWDNRGLGGFRRWCENEGTHYKNHLEGAANR